jgi:uncharacterized protein YdhG (YjbR/CyaY superfamily)
MTARDLPDAPDDPHADYLARCEPAQRDRLLAIRATAEARVPGTLRCMAYQLPALRLPGPKGRVFVYFAAFKQHIGVYPPAPGPPALLTALAPFAGPKGNLAFRHSDPLPIDLIARVAEALAAAYAR